MKIDMLLIGTCLPALIWLLLGIIFKRHGQWKMFIDPQKFLLGRFVNLIISIIVMPLKMMRNSINAWSREIKLVCYGSIANSLLIIIYYLYR